MNREWMMLLVHPTTFNQHINVVGNQYPFVMSSDYSRVPIDANASSHLCKCLSIENVVHHRMERVSSVRNRRTTILISIYPAATTDGMEPGNRHVGNNTRGINSQNERLPVFAKAVNNQRGVGRVAFHFPSDRFDEWN